MASRADARLQCGEPSSRRSQQRVKRLTLRLSALGLLGAAVAFPAHAQFDAPICTQDAYRGDALSMAVDAAGLTHLLRVDRFGGGLIHTTIARTGPRQGEFVDTNIAPRISRFDVVGGSVEDMGLVLTNNGEPRACFYDASLGAIRAGFVEAGAWRFETVLAVMEPVSSCDIALDAQGRELIAFHHTGRLKLATRTAVNTWGLITVDEAAMVNRGADPDLEVRPDGTLVIAAFDRTRERTRLSVRGPGQANFVNIDVDVPGTRFGISPRMAFSANGDLRLFQGVIPERLGVSSDSGLLLTTGRLGGRLATQLMMGENLGGAQAVAAYGDELFLLARERRRSALVNRYDGLRFYDDLPTTADHDVLEGFDSAQAEHAYLYLDLDIGPLGLPHMAWFVDIAQYLGAPPAAVVCLRRPTDADGDLLPDAREGELGLRSDRRDTDGDGRSDGEELLIDHTDPRGEGPLEPDAAQVPPDVSVDILPAVDAAIVAVDFASDGPIDGSIAEPDISESTPDSSQADASEPAADSSQADVGEPAADSSQADASEPAEDAGQPIADSSQADASEPAEDAGQPIADSSQADAGQPTRDATGADATSDGGPDVGMAYIQPGSDCQCQLQPARSGSVFGAFWPLLVLVVSRGLRRSRRSA